MFNNIIRLLRLEALKAEKGTELLKTKELLSVTLICKLTIQLDSRKEPKTLQNTTPSNERFVSHN